MKKKIVKTNSIVDGLVKLTVLSATLLLVEELIKEYKRKARNDKYLTKVFDELQMESIHPYPFTPITRNSKNSSSISKSKKRGSTDSDVFYTPRSSLT